MLERIVQRLTAKKKKSFKDYFKQYKLPLFLFLLSLFLFLIFLAFRPVLFKTWLNYPLELKAEIAFDYYIESFNESCLGTCLEERQILGKIIVLAWHENTKYWEEKIFSYLLISNNLEEKKALVSLSLNIYSRDDIPLILKNIVYSESFSFEIRHYIILAYNPSFITDKDLYLYLIAKALNNDLLIKERQSALLATRGWKSEGNFQIFLQILASQEENVLKESVIDLINSWSIRDISLKEEDVLFISQLASDESFSSNLRPKLIWLLSEYYYLFPDIITNALENIYNNNSLDNISRGFSAKALNYLNAEDLEIPEISQNEWDIYYHTY